MKTAIHDMCIIVGTFGIFGLWTLVMVFCADHAKVNPVERHPDFIPVATASTYGTGEAWHGNRTELDRETLEHFRVGRIEKIG